MEVKPVTPEKIILDEYEQEIEEKFEQHIPLSTEEFKQRAQLLKAAAQNSLKKDKRITIRVYSSDLANLKMIAERQGLKYQSLITSVLHKYAMGFLRDNTKV